METTITTKYVLKTDQMIRVLDANEDNPKKARAKAHWALTCLTERDDRGYPLRFLDSETVTIPFTDGDKVFTVTFPDGYLKPGMELKATVGDWNVVDEDGRHCMQSAFWYVDKDGRAIMCKYKELPSQGGKPPAQTNSQTTLGFGNNLPPVGAGFGVSLPRVGTVGTPSAPAPPQAPKSTDTGYFFCTKEEMKGDEIQPADSCCSYFSGSDDAKRCNACKWGRALVYFS